MVLRNRKPDDIHAGKWNGLGGKFEAGETPETCVIREVREESGLSIVDPHLHGLVMFPGFKQTDWYVFVFSASNFTGELIESPEGSLAWIDDDLLVSLPLWPSDRFFLGWMQKSAFFSACFFYEGEKLLGHTVHFYT